MTIQVIIRLLNYKNVSLRLDIDSGLVRMLIPKDKYIETGFLDLSWKLNCGICSYLLSGHPGRDATLKKITADWHNIPKEVVINYLKSCTTCAERRPIPKTPAGKPIYAMGPLERIQIDLIDMRSISDGQLKWILQAKDHFSKFIWTKSLETKECRLVAKFVGELFYSIGPPKILQSDNGGEFKGHELIDLLQNEFPAVKFVHSLTFWLISMTEIIKPRGTF